MEFVLLVLLDGNLPSDRTLQLPRNFAVRCVKGINHIHGVEQYLFVFCSVLSIIFIRDFQIKSIPPANFIYYFGGKKYFPIIHSSYALLLQLLYVY